MDDPAYGQDASLPSPSTSPPGARKNIAKHLTSKRTWLGDYDYKYLCLPRIPFLTGKDSAPLFIGLDAHLPVLLAIFMGFQHALAMMGGIVTPPLVLSGPGSGHLNLGPDLRAYLVSASLIASGILSLVQILRFRIPGTNFYLGTGLVSVVGTSFTFVPVAESALRVIYANGDFGCGFDADTAEALPCPRAYGAFLGTFAVAGLTEVALSFIPRARLRRVFPPMVTGVTIFLIGAGLTGTGMKYWGGGAGPCYSYSVAQGAAAAAGGGYVGSDLFAVCPNAAGTANPLPWGDARFLGLGLVVFGAIVGLELFGSPFLRSAQVMVGLVLGLVVAAATGYVDVDRIKAAPPITFLWVETFELGFYPPALIPAMVAFTVSTIETVGDVTASMEVSRVPVTGADADSRIQGGLLADGLNSILATLMTTLPNTTFSQNNGVIALTRCANRAAGVWCAVFLVLAGTLEKFSATFTAVPDAVLGGMTTFLFASVAVSGVKILAMCEWSRRTRFIVTCSVALGLGVALVPTWFAHVFPRDPAVSPALRGVYDAVQIVFSTGYCTGSLTAILLNTIIPPEGAAKGAGGADGAGDREDESASGIEDDESR